jgi:DNA-directed RNA polymerase specialized sigma24 family protein
VPGRRRWVELLGRYSSRTDLLDRLHRAGQLAQGVTANRAPEPDSRPAPRPPFKLSQRLSADTTAEILAAYEAGCPSTELATRFKIGKASVLRLLADHDVTRRRQPLTPEQIAEGIRLYESGLSIARVSEYLGVMVRTLGTALRAAGVQMRDSHGRPRPNLKA